MKRLVDRAGWALAGALGLMLVLVAARAIQAGPLDPPGPVASTMKTLGDLPPSWHQILVANNGADSCHSSRFTCVLSNAAVLDSETGLVWQKAPSATPANWASAVSFCTGVTTGGRRGWRLPSPDELSSLSTSGVGVPAGHPFTATAGPYWSSAALTADATRIVTVDPLTVSSAVSSHARGENSTTRFWCVRGAGAGAGADSPFPDAWLPSELPADDGSATQSSRFRVLNSNRVVDSETGLVWELAPDVFTVNWADSIGVCSRRVTLGHLGWRLPTVAEILSLYEFDAGVGHLPTGHPFTGISGEYWTSSTNPEDATKAYTLNLAFVDAFTSLVKTTSSGVKHWCVRGGPGD